MGWLDFLKFNRKTNTPLLNEGNPKNPNIIKNAISVQVFSKMIGNEMEYSIRLINKDNSIQIGKINATTTEIKNSTIPLKELAKQVEQYMTPLTKSTNIHTLNKAKEYAKDKLNTLEQENSFFSVDKDAITYIDNYEPEDMLKYDELKEMPRKVDTSQLTPDELYKIANQIQVRLDKLKTIKTPDDAYADKEDLVYYMKEKEGLVTNPIVEAYITATENGYTLDENTIISISKHMENIENEDGSLYSAYLKLEEQRIFKQIEATIKNYSNLAENADTKLTCEKLIQTLYQVNKFELSKDKNNSGYNIFNYILKELRQQNIVNYVDKVRSLDSAVAKIINLNLQDLPEKTKILQFFYSRIGSLGQLSAGSNSNLLRSYIESTDLKHPDTTQLKEYLLLVAQIEKNYIENEYGPLLEEYKNKNSKNQKNSFIESLNVSIKPITKAESNHSQENAKEYEEEQK